MTTKKQKREAGVLKRERWLAEQKESGLRAQADDRKRRESQRRDSAREKHTKEHSWKKIDKNCILCQDLLTAQRESKEEDSGG